MLIDTIIERPKKILPRELYINIERITKGNSKVVESIINQIKTIQDDKNRMFALLFIFELDDINVDIKKKIFSEFLSDTNNNIQFHMILFAGIYYIEESLSTLHTIKTTSENLILCTTIWSLAKLGRYEGLTNQIAEQLSTLEDDRALTLVASALYLICNDKNSREILLLKDYFLKNFYDEKKQCLFDVVAQSVDFSPEFIGYLLWQSGHEYITISNWSTLDLDWLISKM